MDPRSTGGHDRRLDIAYISALAGSVIGGGLTSGITTWLSERAQARAGQLIHDKLRREDLYRDFIVAAWKVYAGAVMHNEPQIVAPYPMIGRMRVLSSRELLCVPRRSRTQQPTHTARPNLTLHDLA